jgi:hypothetical protein
MKVLALTALFLATTTMSGVSTTNSGVVGVKGSPLMTTTAMLPKCFPNCDGD